MEEEAAQPTLIWSQLCDQHAPFLCVSRGSLTHIRDILILYSSLQNVDHQITL